MGLSMKDSGEMIFNMEKGLRLGLMGRNMKDTTKKERNMVPAHTSGRTVPATKVNGQRTK